jgi:hypothetical protein
LISRLLHEMFDLLLFLGLLFGLLYFMLIAADTESFMKSARYYFWVVAPLCGFGVIFGTVQAVTKSITRKE